MDPLTPPQRRVLAAFYRAALLAGRWPTLQEVATQCGRSHPHVRGRCIELAAAGLLASTGRATRRWMLTEASGLLVPWRVRVEYGPELIVHRTVLALSPIFALRAVEPPLHEDLLWSAALGTARSVHLEVETS